MINIDSRIFEVISWFQISMAMWTNLEHIMHAKCLKVIMKFHHQTTYLYYRQVETIVKLHFLKGVVSLLHKLSRNWWSSHLATWYPQHIFCEHCQSNKLSIWYKHLGGNTVIIKIMLSKSENINKKVIWDGDYEMEIITVLVWVLRTQILRCLWRPTRDWSPPLFSWGDVW